MDITCTCNIHYNTNTAIHIRSISGQIFNQKRVVEELDFDIGTEDMHCNCSTCEYCYEPAGHVVTGDLNIIRDAKLRTLIAKGPSYREQNSINWRVNEEICKQTVSAYIKVNGRRGKQWICEY